MSISHSWHGLSARFAALSRRERIMAFIVVPASVVLTTQALLLDPLLNTRTRLSKEVAEQRAAINGAQQEIQVLASAKASGTGELSPMERRLSEQESLLRDIQAGLLPPKDVTALLESMLNRDGRLHWISLKALPAEPIALPAHQHTSVIAEVKKDLAGRMHKAGTPAPSEEKDRTGLYRHPMELTLRGSYTDLTEYLAALEQLPKQLFWERVDMDASKHPLLEMKIRLYTLGLERAWLQI